jgi:hypothetical protein
VSKPVSVYREIKRRSAQPLRIRKYIPQYFTNAENRHLALAATATTIPNKTAESAFIDPPLQITAFRPAAPVDIRPVVV